MRIELPPGDSLAAVAGVRHPKSNSSARAIRKTHLRCFSAATQLFLLIKWRSAHKPDCVFIHASMIRPQSGLWLNCYSEEIRLKISG